MRNTILAVAAVVTALLVPGASHAFWPFDGLGDAVTALVAPKSVTEGGVTKTRLGSLHPDDRVVTDVDLSQAKGGITNLVAGQGIAIDDVPGGKRISALGQGLDTNAVNAAIAAYDRTNLTARIDAKVGQAAVDFSISEFDRTNVTPRVESAEEATFALSELVGSLLRDTAADHISLTGAVKRVGTLETHMTYEVDPTLDALALSAEDADARIKSLANMVKGPAPSTACAAYAALGYPVLRPETRGTLYVLCTDNRYYDVDTVEPPFNLRMPVAAVTNLFSVTFSQAYLTALFGSGVTWTADFRPRLTDLWKPVSDLCGGIGYPRYHGREATGFVLLCDIIVRDHAALALPLDYGSVAGKFVRFQGLLAAVDALDRRIANAQEAAIRTDRRIDALPPPDFSTANTQLVSTVHAATADLRHKTDLVVYEQEWQHWTWSDAFDSAAPAWYTNAPSALLDALNAYGAPKPYLEHPSEAVYIWAISPVRVGDDIYETAELTSGVPASTNLYYHFRRSGTTAPLYRVRTIRPSTNDIPVAVSNATMAVSEQERAYVDSRFGEIRPVSKYLRIIDFADTFDTEAKRYEAYADEHGYCSSVNRGGIYARNYDWKKTGAMTYVGRLASTSNRYASIFTCNVGTNLTAKLEAECGWTWFHRALPGRAVDGLNEKGVCCNINVVTYEPSRGAAWDLDPEETGRDLNLTMACRYVLDHFATAAEAAAYVAEHGYSPKALHDQGFSIHMMIADEHETWVVEDAVAVNLTAAGLPAVMTNFRVRDPEGDLYGSGYERYDLLVAGGPDAIQAAWFTGAYRKGADGEFVRPTELTGTLVATNAAGEVVQILSESGVNPNEYKLPHTDLVRLRQACKLVIPDVQAERFPRDGSSWQTVHSAVYDISNRCMRIAVQETPDWHVVSIPQAGLDEQRVRDIVQPLVDAKRDLTDNVCHKTEGGVGPWDFRPLSGWFLYPATFRAIVVTAPDDPDRYAIRVEENNGGWRLLGFSVESFASTNEAARVASVTVREYVVPNRTATITRTVSEVTAVAGESYITPTYVESQIDADNARFSRAVRAVVDAMGSFRAYDRERDRWYRLQVVDGTFELAPDNATEE